jgi:hypothetical protein
MLLPPCCAAGCWDAALAAAGLQMHVNADGECALALCGLSSGAAALGRWRLATALVGPVSVAFGASRSGGGGGGGDDGNDDDDDDANVGASDRDSDDAGGECTDHTLTAGPAAPPPMRAVAGCAPLCAGCAQGWHTTATPARSSFQAGCAMRAALQATAAAAGLRSMAVRRYYTASAGKGGPAPRSGFGPGGGGGGAGGWAEKVLVQCVQAGPLEPAALLQCLLGPAGV